MSTLRLTTISNQDGSATVPSQTVISGSAKAWVNFNGTGTVAIRASFNVSSITDNGTGDYTANFTTALADANYGVAGTAGLSASTTYTIVCAPSQGTSPFTGFKTTTAIRFVTTNIASGVFDTSEVYLSFFR